MRKLLGWVDVTNDKANADLVHQRGIDGASPADGSADRIVEVCAGAESGGQSREARGLGLVYVTSAETHEYAVARVQKIIAANVEIVPSFVDLADVAIVGKN